MHKIINNKLDKELSDVRDGISILERLANEPKIMAHFQQPLWKDFLSGASRATTEGAHRTHHESKKLTGHVTVDKPNNKIDSMDMKVHLTLKSNKKPRSHSLSRQDEKKNHEFCSKADNLKARNSDYVSRERDCKRWSEILRNGEVQKPRRNQRRSRSVSTDRDSPFDHLKHKNPSTQHKCQNDIRSVDDEDAFSLFNPVRSLQFLVSELRSIIKPQAGERVRAVFDLVDVLLNKLPSSPVSQTVVTVPDKTETPKLSKQISRSTYEVMRKERDSLQIQLSDKTKSHLNLERKVATLEAKLVRVKSDREELRGALEKLNADHNSLILTLKAKQQDDPSQMFSVQLAEELKLAQECIIKLQATVNHTEKQFRSKMKEVQGILHDGFVIPKNDSVRMSEVFGKPPDQTSIGDFLNYSVPKARPQSPVVRSITPEPPRFSSHSSPSDPELQQYIDSLMKQNGILEEDAFQTFVSIPDFHSENNQNF